MASIEDLKRRIDCHDLAERLQLERPGDRGNYRSPAHDDKNPSLHVYEGGSRWHDHSTGEGGSCIDLVLYVEGLQEVGDAVRRLHELYDLPMDRPERPAGERRQKSIPEYIADRCRAKAEHAHEYLQGRGITKEAIDAAIRAGTVGFNDYRSDKVPEGEAGHLGPAAAFICRTPEGDVPAVDLRLVDPELNGGVKTWTHGEKTGHLWTSDWRRLRRARTVYVVESAINVLSIDSCNKPHWAAVATRGTHVDGIDWRVLEGKRVVICMDNDPPHEKGPQAGRSPGHAAGWRIHELLTGLNIAAHFVDQSQWDGIGDEPEFNDVNDLLQDRGPAATAGLLTVLDQALIPGVSYHRAESRPAWRRKQKSRVFLPAHDWSQYPRFRCKEDFTTYVRKWGDEGEEGDSQPEFMDLCGFRIAALSRVQVASATATMTGEQDNAPETLFAVSVQTPRHGDRLIRRVFEDERLHSVDQWQKFGPVYAPRQFLRGINVLERGAEIGARDAVNFVGLAWKNGTPVVNEGPDCYFRDPAKQCPYHLLTFPSGRQRDARRVLDAYQDMFTHNAASLLLLWALGGHLKAMLGFWPHMVLQADKGAGKSTLVKWLERSIGMTMFSGQSLQTEFRLLTSISHTSHPVGWEELSARGAMVIDKAVSMLQESYQYTTTRRGAELTEYLLSAPVLLAGEDVPVRSLIGKVVRTDLTGRKGDLPDEDIPRFPVREWLEFLAGHSKAQIARMHREYTQHLIKASRASGEDDGAIRMAGNYGALAVAWKLLAEFCEVDTDHGQMPAHLIGEMNAHIADTSADREPWVWIIEVLFDEISNGAFRYPYKFAQVEADGTPEDCIVLRMSHVMAHLRTDVRLRATFDALPVKSDRVLKKQLKRAGVIHEDRVDARINGKRECHLTALSLDRLRGYGLHVSEPEDIPYQHDVQRSA